MKLSYQHVNIFQKNTIFKTSNCVLAWYGEYCCASGTICAMGQRNVRD